MPRKKPFSNKQKKQQLLQKRRNKGDSRKPLGVACSSSDSEHDNSEPEISVTKVHHQPSAETSYDPNRYRLHFEKDSQQELDLHKHEAKTKPLKTVAEEEMEISLDDIFKPGSILDIPKRPPWDYKMSKEKVESQESKMFELYLKEIHGHYKPEDLSYFEHNLETWQQLWRVLEMSNIVLFITDIRHPALHFSPSLFHHVKLDMNKDLVLVLNKVDLVPPPVAVAWRAYFQTKFPDLHVILFTSFPKEASTYQQVKVHTKMRRKGRRLLTAVGPEELLKVVEGIYKGKVDLSAWKSKLESGNVDTIDAVDSMGEESSDDDLHDNNSSVPAAQCSAILQSENACKAVVTIGMIGHPNVGKSSLINGLVGKKVVSTSRTPGHTKHFQTIYLTPTVCLCDCPGLVFPSLVNKRIQILSGIYPIAQVREPYTAVGYLAERVPLIKLLQLQHPNPPSGEQESMVWTAWDICDAWANKKQYFTAKASRLDTYRAANSLLRLALDGRISMFFVPPQFTKQREYWEAHPEVNKIKTLQDKGMISEKEIVQSFSDSTHSSGEEMPSEPPIHINRFDALLTLHDDVSLSDDS
ncbi:guanine nucleotide-binding protein-like 1 isoform X2 [Dysidea avara]|uniref:guanine nucleotide-binding protein-like 1 isoform X2 n=1 Tax=Dysidea avara TaxID=196820 RepID=UPI003320DE36